MSSSLLSLYGTAEADSGENVRPFSTLPTRRECLDRLHNARGFDLVVLGGGLTGAVTAHQAALVGINVLVLHSSYFGSNAQSWSVGYCVLSAYSLLSRIKGARAVGSVVGGLPAHLRSSRSLRSSRRGRSFADRIVERVCRGVHGLGPGELPTCDERALIRETMLAARQEGAICLSDIEIPYVDAESESGLYTVAVRDPLQQVSYEVRAGSLLLDPSTTRIPTTRLGRQVGPRSRTDTVYRRIVCRVEGGERLSAQVVIAGEYVAEWYLVVPTSVPQIVECIVAEREREIQPHVEGILRAEGLRLTEIIFAGTFRQESVARHELEQYGGLFYPRERGPWDAWLSAACVIAQLKVAANQSDTSSTAVVRRVLAGAVRPGEIERFRAVALEAGLTEGVVDTIVRRWHGRVRYIAEFERGLELVCADIVRGEVELAFRSDQVATVEDLMFGSLSQDMVSDWRGKMGPLSNALAELSSTRS